MTGGITSDGFVKRDEKANGFGIPVLGEDSHNSLSEPSVAHDNKHARMTITAEDLCEEVRA